MKLREEYRTSILRGLAAGAFAAAVAFFNAWVPDASIQELVRDTALAGLLTAGPFLGFGRYDAWRNDKRKEAE